MLYQTENTDHIPWRPRDIIYYGIISIFFVVMIESSGSFFAGAATGLDKGIVAFFFYLLQSLCFILPLFLISKKRDIPNWKEALGIRKVTPYILFLGPLIAECASILTLGMLEFSKSFQGYDAIPGLSGEQSPFTEYFGNSDIGIVLAGISIVILAPLIEEIVFRGFIQQAFRSKYSEVVSVIGSATIFALIHFQPEVALPLFLLGLILGTLFSRTKSILPGLLFHILNNGLVLVIQVLALAK